MTFDVEKEVFTLGTQSTRQLQHRYADVFGEATRSFNKTYLIRRILWRMQALQEGGLSRRARQRAVELANDAELRVGPPRRVQAAASASVMTLPFKPGPDRRLPMPGTLLRREYKGQTLHVRVLSSGFEFNGEVYRSLTAIAKRVTGSHWNGLQFFGCRPRGNAVKEAS